VWTRNAAACTVPDPEHKKDAFLLVMLRLMLCQQRGPRENKPLDAELRLLSLIHWRKL
jgi:hypothetical protein